MRNETAEHVLKRKYRPSPGFGATAINPATWSDASVRRCSLSTRVPLTLMLVQLSSSDRLTTTSTTNMALFSAPPQPVAEPTTAPIQQ